MVRDDEADLIYKGEDGKFEAAVEDIVERNDNGQPILVGTISVEKSEKLSRLLQKRGIAHEVLNAKQHEREAEIITQAGKLGVGHRRHQHGRPRRRHPARRQPRRPRPPANASARGSCSTPTSTRPATRAAAPLPGGVQGRRRQGPRPRRPLRARHRTARVPPHRQPAARPVRPPGRPGREPVLPLARRRAHAPVRDRAHAARDGRVVPRRRSARVEDGHARPSSARSAPSRTATSRSARTSSSTTK